MRLALLCALVAWGCSAAPVPAPRPAPAAAPADPAAADPAPAAPPPEPAAAPPAASWRDLAIDPAQAFALRARIRRAGAVYETRSGPRLGEGDGRAVLVPVIALDADAGGSPRRPRVLCRPGDYRVAVHVDASDLGWAAQPDAFLGPAPDLPESPGADTPGLHLAGGAALDPLGPSSAGGPRRVRYRGLFLAAEGWIARDQMDVVFRPSRIADPEEVDGELIADAELRDAPGGRVVARINRMGAANRLYLERLGGPTDGAVLIRYTEEDAAAVGWVPEAAVRAIEPTSLSSGGMGGIGTGSIRVPRVKLPRGTPLTSPATGAVLGVVTREHDFICAGPCDADPVSVKLTACTAPITLTAPHRTPEAPSDLTSPSTSPK